MEREDKEPVTDTLLQLFVWITEKSKLGWPVTLQLGGMHVSGFISTPDQYLKGLRDTMRERAIYSTVEGLPEDQLRAGVQSIFDRMSEESEAASIQYLQQDDGDEDAWEQTKFIHLRDAKFLSPDGRILSNEQGLWWRGKLDRVDRFFFGAIGPPPR